MNVQLRVLLFVLLIYAGNTNSLESGLQGSSVYAGIAFQNTELEELTATFGKAVLFNPPGEVLLPDEICYVDPDGLHATFFIEHHGPNNAPTNTVIGVIIDTEEQYERRNQGFFKRPFPCEKTEVKLPPCVGQICIGNSYNETKEILKNAKTFYERSNEWRFEVNLTANDSVLKVYQLSSMPDWMFPSHVVRISRNRENTVTSIYSVIEIDTI